MHRILLTILVPLLGAMIFFAGLFYDVLFAGIPYQDPTEELAEEYAHHSSVADVLYKAGGISFLAGLAAVPFIWRWSTGSKGEVT